MKYRSIVRSKGKGPSFDYSRERPPFLDWRRCARCASRFGANLPLYSLDECRQLMDAAVRKASPSIPPRGDDDAAQHNQRPTQQSGRWGRLLESDFGQDLSKTGSEQT